MLAEPAMGWVGGEVEGPAQAERRRREPQINADGRGFGRRSWVRRRIRFDRFIFASLP
jgi:hypothetical protein